MDKTSVDWTDRNPLPCAENGVFLALGSDTKCNCSHCTNLVGAYLALQKEPLFDDDNISDNIYDAKLALQVAIDKLQNFHKPDLYNHAADCPLQNSPGEELDRAADLAEENCHALPKKKSENFMICDHCRGHGLPCNEAAVCEQCKYSSTACIHRVCRRSPNSREKCPDSECRYLHMDYLPTNQHVPVSAYIALPGRLSEYCFDGKRNAIRWMPMHSGLQAHYDRVIERQEHARQDMNAQIANGSTSRAEFRVSCGERCRPIIDDSPEPYDESGCLSADQQHHSGDESAEEDGDDEVGSPNTLVCDLCQREVSLYGLTPCNGWLCARCMIVRRALLCDNSCHICQEVCEDIIITTDALTKYEDFNISPVPVDLSKIIGNIGARFENSSTRQAFDELVETLFARCPIDGCTRPLRSAKDFIKHMYEEHAACFCRACLAQGHFEYHVETSFWHHKSEEHQQVEMVLLPFHVLKAEYLE